METWFRRKIYVLITSCVSWVCWDGYVPHFYRTQRKRWANWINRVAGIYRSTRKHRCYRLRSNRRNRSKWCHRGYRAQWTERSARANRKSGYGNIIYYQLSSITFLWTLYNVMTWETLSVLLTLCKPPVTGGFLHTGPVMRSFDVLFAV